MSAPKRRTAKTQSMFELGKNYIIKMVEGGDEGTLSYRVVAFEHPLLKLRNPHIPDIVVNVMSPNFVSAQLSEHQGKDPKGGLAAYIARNPDAKR